MYDSQSLKKLSVQELPHTLAIFILYPERVRDITTLLKYAYARLLKRQMEMRTYEQCWLIAWGAEMDTLIVYGEIPAIKLDNETHLLLDAICQVRYVTYSTPDSSSRSSLITRLEPRPFTFLLLTLFSTFFWNLIFEFEHSLQP